MSNRTFACLRCRKLQRKPMSVAAFRCPHCQGDCVCVHWKLHVPAPRKRRKWNRFWAQYLLELRMIEQFRDGQHGDEMHLPLLNQRWERRAVEPGPARGSAGGSA